MLAILIRVNRGVNFIDLIAISLLKKVLKKRFSVTNYRQCSIIWIFLLWPLWLENSMSKIWKVDYMNYVNDYMINFSIEIFCCFRLLKFICDELIWEWFHSGSEDPRDERGPWRHVPVHGRKRGFFSSGSGSSNARRSVTVSLSCPSFWLAVFLSLSISTS